MTFFHIGSALVSYQHKHVLNHFYVILEYPQIPQKYYGNNTSKST